MIMAFMVHQNCPCCRSFDWHCKGCWYRFHNGERDKDFIAEQTEDWLQAKKGMIKFLEKEKLVDD